MVLEAHLHHQEDKRDAGGGDTSSEGSVSRGQSIASGNEARSESTSRRRGSLGTSITKLFDEVGLSGKKQRPLSEKMSGLSLGLGADLGGGTRSGSQGGEISERRSSSRRLSHTADLIATFQSILEEREEKAEGGGGGR